MLDLTLVEENDTPNLTVAVMPRTGKVTLLTMDSRLHADRFKDVITLASTACKVIHVEMKDALYAKANALLKVANTGTGTEGDDTYEHD
jgi:exosome complex component RRP41